MSNDPWITFDCFGTLIDWLSGYRTALVPLAGSRVDELIQSYHVVEAEIEAAQPHRSYSDVLTVSLKEAALRINLTISEDQTSILVREWAKLPLYSDAKSALASLRTNGWNIGILTNCDNGLLAKTLGRYSILKPDMTVTSEQVKSYKPNLGHFLWFERQAVVSLERWVHVGCSVFHDIEPAHYHGISCIWIDREKTGVKPASANWVLPDLVDLPQIVDKLIQTRC